MAYYLPSFGRCFGAACSDIFPEDEPSGGGYVIPGLPISFPSPPSVNVGVNVPGGSAMIPPPVPMERHGLPWWLWLGIGILVARVAMKD